MPCHDARREETYDLDSQILREENARLTYLLCAVGKAMLYREHVPPEVVAWWKEHAGMDAIRGEPWNKESPK